MSRSLAVWLCLAGAALAGCGDPPSCREESPQDAGANVRAVWRCGEAGDFAIECRRQQDPEAWVALECACIRDGVVTEGRFLASDEGLTISLANAGCGWQLR